MYIHREPVAGLEISPRGENAFKPFENGALWGGEGEWWDFRVHAQVPASFTGAVLLAATTGYESGWEAPDEEEYSAEGWDAAELQYGKLLLEGKHPVLQEYLQREIRIRTQILDRLKDRDSTDVRRRITELEEELKIAERGMDHYAV